MRKIVIIALILSMMLLLAACGGSKIKAKPLSAREPSTPTAAVTADTTEPSPEPVYEDSDSGMTAAEAIKDLQSTIQTTSTDNTGNFYPEAPEGVTGRDALKARTKALMSQTVDVDLGIEADQRTGSIADDLPDEYDNSGSAGE